jgi:hypothetical protein
MKKDEEIFLALEESCIFVWFIFHSWSSRIKKCRILWKKQSN